MRGRSLRLGRITMKLKNMPKEELQLLSYNDLTYMILKENKKVMNTPSIFKIICDLLEYNNEEYENKIGDYYTSLALDKRFILLDSAEWDLRENHSVELSVDDDEEEVVEEDEEEVIDNMEPEADDDDDEELEDDNSLSLNIVEEDDLEDM